MSAHTVSEGEFLSLVSGGEHRRAAEWLVLRYADEVMGLCLAMVRNRTTAEDLVQDVFGRAFVGLKDFRGEASARTWLLKIARNRCFDHLRARKREPWGAPGSGTALEPDTLPDEVPLPSELLARRADVEAALDELPEADRALIVLRFRNGLDYAELAIAFGLKQGAVRMRVSRSLNKMRRALEVREGAIEDVEPAPAPQAATSPPPRFAPPRAYEPVAEEALEEFADEDTGESRGIEADDDAAVAAAADDFADFIAPRQSQEEVDAAPEFDLEPEPEPEPEPERALEIERTATKHAVPQSPARPLAAPAPAKRAVPPPPARAAQARPRKPVAEPADFAPSPIFGRRPALSAPPVEHPLTAYFAATRDALSNDLRSRLLDGANQV